MSDHAFTGKSKELSLSNTSLFSIQRDVLLFSKERDWLRFHNPKDLAAAIAVESAELLEVFQWKPDSSCVASKLTSAERTAIESEIADVLMYTLCLANALGSDAAELIRRKMLENESRFPAAER